MSDKKYWTTLEQLEGAEEYLRFRDDEFREKPAEDMEEGGSLTTSRRGALKATGAAAIFMGAVGCNPEKKLIPYLNQPEESIPGNPVYYTGLDADGENGLVVKTTEGRPIRLDGNEDFPVNRGKLDAVGNAAIIDLYDPDRLRTSVKKVEGKSVPVEEPVLSTEVAAQLKAAGSKAVLVTKPVHGVANQALIESFLMTFPGLRHVQISSQIGTDAIMASQKASFGQRVLPAYRYDRSKLIVSLGFDILAESPNIVEAHRLFADSRRYKNDGSMGRVVCFESTLSMTGGAGDERHRVKPQAYVEVALALVVELEKLGAKMPLGVSLTQTATQVEKDWSIKEGVISQLAHELWEAKGESLVVSGGSAAHMESGDLLLAATNLLNVMLGNDGKTVQYGEGSLKAWEESESGLAGLLADANAGRVQALVVVDVNLAYLSPSKAGVKEAFSKIPYKVGLFSHEHETGVLCDAVYGTHHFLENWNDAEPRQGLFAVGQPTIAPLWQTISRQQALMNVAAAAGSVALKGSWSDFLKATWKTSIYSDKVFAADFASFWDGALRKGFVDLGASARASDLPVRTFKVSALKSALPKKIKGMQLVMHRTSLHGNGDSMNNPWLVETPDPISKITWENYVSVNVAMAKKEDLTEGQFITLKTSAGQLVAPVHIQPGLADGVMSLALGWGRGPEAGQVAAGPSGEGNGVNGSVLAEVQDGKIIYSGLAVKWSKAKGSTKLACVQGHQYLTNDRIRMTGEGERKILQDAFLEEFNTEGNDSWQIPYHMPTDISIWRQKFNDSTTHKWAMAIDTNTCTGCGSCMVSCQAENNISVVGKDEILINREMHWIRIDRYYTAADSNPEAENTDDVDVVQQPMLCQHCDNAPCETVCPVIATSHNEEGLNIQTYNRCVGTRYCSNNCPYKVRHYNWYDYSDYRAGLHQSGRPLTRLLRQVGIKGKELKDKTEYPLMLQFNPDVTVRSRGVMEKCSFCVHKIRRWHTEERALGRDLPEVVKKTACQQACPADAITFGNILDENSAVSKAVEAKGTYKVLKELNTEANVTYMTRLRNRAMPAHQKVDAHGAGHDQHGETKAHH